MSVEKDAIDEEARWRAYQAWRRKRRGGVVPSEPSEPPPVPAADGYVSYPWARTVLISIAALGIAGAMIGGILLLALGHAPNGPALQAPSVPPKTNQAARLGPVGPTTPATARVDVPTVSEAPAPAPSPVKARVQRRRLTPMEAYARRRRLTPMEAYARSPPAPAVDRAQ